MIQEKKPLKRVKELQELSREHHHGLLLCWKITEDDVDDMTFGVLWGRILGS